MRLFALLLLPLPALAGLPGEGETVYSVDVRATTDPDTHMPVYGGLGVSAAIPLADDETIPDLELRADLQASSFPDNEVRTLLGDAGVADVRYGILRSRLSAMASWGAASRTSGLRLRIGPELLVEGTAGSESYFGDFTGPSSLSTRTLRGGLTGAFGVAVPFGEAPEDPLLDLRFGASVLAPLAAGGGQLGNETVRELALTVGDETFASYDTVGRESRAWGEGTVSFDQFRVGLTVGMHHRARDRRFQAIVDAGLADVDSFPVVLFGQLRAGVVF